MSAIIISVFLIIEIPLMVITMLHALRPKVHQKNSFKQLTIIIVQDRDWMDYETANYIVLIINTFMCLSCPLNLAVYCSTSKAFRKTFNTVIGRLVCLVDINLSLVPPITDQTSPDTKV